MSHESESTESLSSPLSSKWEEGGLKVFMVATLALGAGLAFWAHSWNGEWWWVTVLGIGPFLVVFLSMLAMPARGPCPQCGNLLEKNMLITIVWCETCKDYYQFKGDFLTSVDPGYVDEKHVFAVSFTRSTAPPESWIWPQVCPTCNSAAVDHSVIDGKILLGGEYLGFGSTAIRYREVSLRIPRCAKPHRGVYLEPGYATRLLFCSYRYWKELIRLNRGIVQPDRARDY